MNTRGIAAEYRLSHWAEIIRARQESGLSVKAFCENAGFHSNLYYYWQKKLREAVCEELSESQAGTAGLTPIGFTEIKLTETRELPPAMTAQNQISVEAGGMRITAGSEYPADKLSALLRELASSC
jgi:transposase-like protein